ncbi:MAG: helix-turn-helix domain-containing protein [Lachnospiraceae bacterium]|nr:helix-turn-helix domain-containing protein [Lachnospiraceae bacterium]
MILADKIINERKKNGWSQEELADMLDVSRQSVSKWEGAQSVPDLQKILKLAELFGVSTDYLLKDEMGPEDRTVDYEITDVTTFSRHISMEEATEYISLRKEVLPKVALGVVLCITCPVILIFLSGLTASDNFSISQSVAVATGLLVLFGQVGAAVFLFISQGGRLSKYDFLEKEAFETGYGVDGMVKERMAAYETVNRNALVTGVLLCILSPVPLVICSVLSLPSWIITSMVCVLLIMVACAVYMFVSICGVGASYKILLQSGDYTPQMKVKNGKLEAVSGIYWMFITVVYLAVSFLTMRWDRTWIIWAVSGVLFALIRGIAEAFVKS